MKLFVYVTHQNLGSVRRNPANKLYSGGMILGAHKILKHSYINYIILLCSTQALIFNKQMLKIGKTVQKQVNMLMPHLVGPGLGCSFFTNMKLDAIQNKTDITSDLFIYHVQCKKPLFVSLPLIVLI
jgi:hypothetical protein